MTSRRRICVVTGSRADYGLLYWIISDLRRAPQAEMQLVVTGMHLAPEFGRTVSVIEADGFPIAARVESLLSSDTAAGIAKSIGIGTIGFASEFARLAPEIILLLGDRFDIFAAAQAALVANIPIAHIAGGDTTEGAFDEALRHSITKMAQVHFVTNAESAARVRQMGEDPAHIHVVGSPGIDYIHRLPTLSRRVLERELGVRFRTRNVLLTFHPVTLAPAESLAQFQALLDALESLGPDVGLFFTHSNADTGGRGFNQLLDTWADRHENAQVFTSLGQRHYLSLMAHVDAVVGNSSSGLYEAPSFGKPTVDIGDRQRGRLAATSVIRCAARTDAIVSAIAQAFTMDCAGTVNPYGDGESSKRIVEMLLSIADPAALIRKHFHMLAGGSS
jgi:UDP-hydrolysing UDP-N-acetyl-D-glucosamine 2-epimerase